MAVLRVKGPKGPEDIVIIDETDLADWVKRGYTEVKPAAKPAATQPQAGAKAQKGAGAP